MLEKQSVFGNGKLGKFAPKGLNGTVEDVMRGQRQIEEARLKKAETAKGKLGKSDGKVAGNNKNGDINPYVNAVQQAYEESATEMVQEQGLDYADGSSNFSEEDEA